VATDWAKPNEAEATRIAVQMSGRIRRMWDIRSWVDGMNFLAEKQGKLLFFMKISLFMEVDIGIGGWVSAL
jgi:hypothetical protein